MRQLRFKIPNLIVFIEYQIEAAAGQYNCSSSDSSQISSLANPSSVMIKIWSLWNVKMQISPVPHGLICHWQVDSCSRSPFHYSHQAVNDAFHLSSHLKILKSPTSFFRWFYWQTKSHIVTHFISLNCRIYIRYILSYIATLIEWANETPTCGICGAVAPQHMQQSCAQQQFC